MKVTDDSIKRFFKRQSSQEEAAKVALFLKTHPEVLDQYLSEYEWSAIEADKTNDKLSDETWKTLYNKYKGSIIKLWIKRATVAACTACLLVIGYYLIKNEKNNQQEIAQNKVEILDVKQRLIANNLSKDVNVFLEDSTVVKLAQGSILRFSEPFQNNRRDVFLEGEAHFKVSKDKLKPFTVFAGSLATTALGTEFTITANRNESKITVKLFTGKVVITSANTNLKGWKHNVYLEPGEQLKYDADKTLAAVQKINDSKVILKKTKPLLADNKTVVIKKDELTFAGNSLPDVMNHLADFYRTEIKYDKDEIAEMNFTGTVTRKDSLHVVLKIIAQMNGLEILDNHNEFIVHIAK